MKIFTISKDSLIKYVLPLTQEFLPVIGISGGSPLKSIADKPINS